MFKDFKPGQKNKLKIDIETEVYFKSKDYKFHLKKSCRPMSQKVKFKLFIENNKCFD